MAKEMTRARVAFGLLCGLAVCCSVMYITADGNEAVHEDSSPEAPISVDSEDVQKVATIFTNTPDGRMRLEDYLANVEKEIAAEEAARKNDVAQVREKMARNFAFNQAARSKLKKQMLKKMAKNAKRAKKELDRSMRMVQKKFAQAADLANKRNSANIARSKKLRSTIAKNKAEATAELNTAVVAQQRSMAALRKSMNERITQTNKHVQQNAAQIKEEAKVAREALESAVATFDDKVAKARTEAANGRSKLQSQLADQDKAQRQWANNKLKAVAAETAAQFTRVREKMAEDRAHADQALNAASSRMSASLNAFTALNDKRFQSTVSDIAAAKKEAKDRVDAASTEFNSKILLLRSTVNQQVDKANARVSALSGVVEKNKLAQAKVNRNVEAEMKRMMKIGNDRYAEHLKKDAELKSLIDSNKAATDKALKAMGARFTAELDAVRATQKKNRAHASAMLAKQSAGLYSAIAKSQEAQMKANKEMQEQTATAVLDIADALHEAKSDFTTKLGALHTNIVDNDKKFQGRMEKLTGVVTANAVKSKEGRDELESIMKANKADLDKAVSEAIREGENRMMAAQNKLESMNEKTKSALNMRITSEISKLKKEANSQIEHLHLNTKKAREEMKAQLLYAVRAAAEEAKDNLAAAVTEAKEAFAGAEKAEADAQADAAADRKRIAGDVADQKAIASRQLKNAVKMMEDSMLALKSDTRTAIKKTNTDVMAYGHQLEKEAADVKALMASNMEMLTEKISEAQTKTAGDIAAADAASAASYATAMDQIKEELATAQKESDDKFAGFYAKMAKNREEVADDLAVAVDTINDSIAKQAALADTRFSKTVKDIEAARKEAADQVAGARKSFSTSLIILSASVKDQEQRLLGDIQKVSGVHATNVQNQAIVNRQLEEEHSRILKLTNAQISMSVQARGKIKVLLNENKRAAHEEVQALDKLFTGKLGDIRDRNAKHTLEAANDLTEATEKMYEELLKVETKAAINNDASAAAIATYEKEAAGAIANAETNFNARLNTLTNDVAANAEHVESQFEVLTGIINDAKEAGAEDMALIRTQREALGKDMNKRIVKAIELGEAAATRVAKRATANLADAKKTMLVEISEHVEAKADELFTTIQGGHQKLADNYLSLKAYAVAAIDNLNKYVTAGKGKNLSSLGDILKTVGDLSEVVVEAVDGIGMGLDTIPAIFTGDKIKVDGTMSKVNGLVKEYTKVTNDVRQRWPMGLGKYLLLKLEESMLEKGALQVDKIADQNGNWVFINGHAVGLSNKLNDFESLAVRMTDYEATLAALTAALSGKVEAPPTSKANQIVYAKQQWDGVRR